jgi:hypothetical protein
MKKINIEGWSVGFVEVNAADAQEALDGMTESQRTSSEASIKNIVAEITTGNFHISNDAIVVTSGGVWLNGKHRLQGVVRTNTTQRFIMLTIPDADAMRILRLMDCGVTRSIAHVAEMMIGVKNSALVASIAKQAMAYDRGLLTCQGQYGSTNRTAQDKFISRDMLIDYIKAYSEKLQQSASYAKSLNAEYGFFGTSGPSFVHYMITKKHSKAMADQFLDVLFTGRGDRFECVEPLRKAIGKDLRSMSKASSAVKTASIFKAFKAWKSGTIPVKGFVSPGEKFPGV